MKRRALARTRKLQKLCALFFVIFFLYIIRCITYMQINDEINKDKYWQTFESMMRDHRAQMNLKSLMKNWSTSQPTEPTTATLAMEKQKVKKKNMPLICPILNSEPKADIQLLSMYERIELTDKDGDDRKIKINFKEKQGSSESYLKVFIVPYFASSDSVAKQYDTTPTPEIFNNILETLDNADDQRTLTWTDTNLLSSWWHTDATETQKYQFKNLLNSGKIEIVTGSWVMNVGANSHWLSVLQQLTTGHQWLLDNLGYTPKNAWAIDPFGHSSSQPYILKLAGLHNSVIQRMHYRVKKELALNRQLEFRWRQLWDGKGESDMLTHVMLEVPSCGPEICCELRIQEESLVSKCPRGTHADISESNLAERSSVILEQWRKISHLYRSNAVMIPLAVDFRFSDDSQYKNFQMIMDYINNNGSEKAEIFFGTLQDYFEAVDNEMNISSLPVLSGDFITYPDREVDSSGYYPAVSHCISIERVLLAYFRAAETIASQATINGFINGGMAMRLRARVESVRRMLAHAPRHEMLDAIRECQAMIQQGATYILVIPTSYDLQETDVFLYPDEDWSHTQDGLPERVIVALNLVEPKRKVLFYNPLAFRRQEVVTVMVSCAHVLVLDSEGKPVQSQVSPVVTMSGGNRLVFSGNRYQLTFAVTVGALAMTVYTIEIRDPDAYHDYSSHAKVYLYNGVNNSGLPSDFSTQPTSQLSDDVTVQVNNGTRVVATAQGLIKSIVSADGAVSSVHMDFVYYKNRNNNSDGKAPHGRARVLTLEPYPDMIMVEGPLKSSLHAAIRRSNVTDIFVTISVYNNPSLPQSEVEIINTVLIDQASDDLEIAMRFSTSISNGDIFYTDANGMQMVKRRYLSKLPLQANFYLLPAAAYIEDDKTRFTLLTSTPLGMAALAPGQIEILLQKTEDHTRSMHEFKIIAEKAIPCDDQRSSWPWGRLSVGAHVTSQTLLQPLAVMHVAPGRDVNTRRGAPIPGLGVDVVLASCRSNVSGVMLLDGDHNDAVSVMYGIGMTFQRVGLDVCYGNKNVTHFYLLADVAISLEDLTGGSSQEMYHTSLTFTRIQENVRDGILALCPMEIKSIFLLFD